MSRDHLRAVHSKKPSRGTAQRRCCRHREKTGDVLNVSERALNIFQKSGFPFS